MPRVPMPPTPDPPQFVNDRLVETARRELRKASGECPSELFHFTDAAGLLGILRHRTIWASFVESLNDASEVEYGVALARTVLEQEPADVDAAFRAIVVRFLDPIEADSVFRIEWRPFVVSFCERADLAVHWLHYGRDGTGYAIGFDRGIAQSPFELFRVVYDTAEQSAQIRSLTRAMFATLQDVSRSVAVDGLADVAAHMTASFLRALAVRFKHDSFAAEQEWRLITHDLLIHGTRQDEGPAIETCYRTIGGRIVPYKPYAPPLFAPSRLVVGASAAMACRDHALAQLLETAGCPAIPVMRSTVPVRP